MTQQKLGRRWAPSLAGSPQIRSVPQMGWTKVRRKGTATVDADMPDGLRKKHVKQAFERFVWWMKQEDGAEWDGRLPVIQGPSPHFDIKQPDVQYGDNGASRPVARNLQEDLTGTGKEDYHIIASFWVRERITEVRTEFVSDILANPAVRLMRSN